MLDADDSFLVDVARLAEEREACLSKNASAGGPVERGVSDDPPDRVCLVCLDDECANGVGCVAAAPARLDDRVANFDGCVVDEPAAYLANDEIVSRAMDEVGAEWRSSPDLRGDPGRELGRMAEGDAYVWGSGSAEDRARPRQC